MVDTNELRATAATAATSTPPKATQGKPAQGFARLDRVVRRWVLSQAPEPQHRPCPPRQCTNHQQRDVMGRQPVSYVQEAGHEREQSEGHLREQRSPDRYPASPASAVTTTSAVCELLVNTSLALGRAVRFVPCAATACAPTDSTSKQAARSCNETALEIYRFSLPVGGYLPHPKRA